jgi:hypothetical protein
VSNHVENEVVLEARQKELLPVEYFHTVFTIPHEINSLASFNSKIIYDILFKSAWTTIQTAGKDKKRLGGDMGMLAALHTWSQTLMQHIHLHCIIPGGALKNDLEWISCHPGFLFPVRVLSRLFRKTFLHLLKEAFQTGVLNLPGMMANLNSEKAFEKWLAGLKKHDWVVYAKKPFNGAQGALNYLSRYVYKSVISNERILSCGNRKVSFTWRDYSDQSKTKIMELDAHEFIRRFLLHVLPDKFVRIRFFGFLANSQKSKKIAIIAKLLNHKRHHTDSKNPETIQKLMERLTGIDITACPICKTGKLRTIKTLPNLIRRNNYWDTS